jgi:hypothetical protein
MTSGRILYGVSSLTCDLLACTKSFASQNIGLMVSTTVYCNSAGHFCSGRDVCHMMISFASLVLVNSSKITYSFESPMLEMVPYILCIPNMCFEIRRLQLFSDILASKKKAYADLAKVINCTKDEMDKSLARLNYMKEEREAEGKASTSAYTR